MSIFGLFSGGNSAAPAQQAPAQQAAPAEPGNMPSQPSVNTAQSAATAANGVVPDNVQQAAPVSPLDKYKDIWEAKSTDDASGSPVPALDPTKLQEVMSKADFSQHLNPESLAQIANGGEGAVQAFVESLNTIARQSMMQSTMIANKLVESAITNVQSGQETKFTELMRKHNLSESLQSSNPLFSNPAVKPVMEAVQSQLATKYPSASTQELVGMAQEFVKAMGESFNPAPAPTQSGGDGMDWSKFLQV